LASRLAGFLAEASLALSPARRTGCGDFSVPGSCKACRVGLFARVTLFTCAARGLNYKTLNEPRPEVKELEIKKWLLSQESSRALLEGRLMSKRSKRLLCFAASA
jgi:hypothetical protein